mgnify:CR=1 FL=1
MILQNAKDYNARYREEGHDKIPERIESLLSLNPERKRIEQRLEVACVKWRRMFKQYVEDNDKFFDALVETKLATFSDIEIDKTLQRFVYFDNIIEWIENFDIDKVMAIKCYREPDGQLVCWDGQHTIFILYYIITKIFNLNISDVQIPIQISKSRVRANIRRVSLSENGGGKTPFNDVDKYDFEVYGVRQDGITTPSWLATELKQQHLETYDIFVADKRMHNTLIAGALTRTNELMDINFSTDITKYFAQWCYFVNGSNRPFGGIEVDLIYNYFHKCENEGIDVTTEYVMDVAEACKGVLGDDFNNEEFWAKGKRSLTNYLLATADDKSWYIKKDGTVNGNATNRTSRNQMAFFCQCLEHNGIQTPEYDREFIVKPEESF